MSSRLINLVPLFAARRIAAEFLRRRGLEFFTLAEKDGPAFRLDPRKLDLVVELARRDAKLLTPGLPASARDLRFCKRQLRREVIRQVTTGVATFGG